MRGRLFILSLVAVFFLSPLSVFASLVIKIDPSDNPVTTEYAIYEKDRNLYLQADGTLQADPVWRTYENWGGDLGFEVLDLEEEATYTFQVKARSGSADETPFSDAKEALNVRGPRDLPADFVTLKAATNVVSKQSFIPVGGMVESTGHFIFTALNAFILTGLLFLLYLLFKRSRLQEAVQVLASQRLLARTALFCALLIAVRVVFSSALTTLASWNPPDDSVFSADNVQTQKGSILTYQVILKNNETKREQVVVSDVVPQGTKYIPGSMAVGTDLFTDAKDNDAAYYDVDKNTLYINIPLIGANEQKRIYFSVDVL